MRRTLEIVFRHIPQLLLVIVLIPGIALAIAFVLPRSYQGTSTLWALRRYEIITANGSQSDLQATPAATQTDALTELLHTRVFALAVAQDANLASTLSPSVQANPQNRDDALFADISSHVTVIAGGSNLFTIAYTNKSPATAQAVVQAVIKNYGLQSAGFSVVEGQQLVQSYQQQLTQAQKAADAAASAEQQYLAEHPSLTVTTAQNDPQYALLHSQSQQAQTTLQGIQTEIATLNQEISLQGSGSDSLFKVLDAPILPKATSRSKTFLIFGGAGLGIALVVCAVYITVLVRRSRAIYTASDLASVTHYPVVMQLPHVAKSSVVLPMASSLPANRHGS